MPFLFVFLTQDQISEDGEGIEGKKKRSLEVYRQNTVGLKARNPSVTVEMSGQEMVQGRPKPRHI